MTTSQPSIAFDEATPCDQGARTAILAAILAGGVSKKAVS